MGSMVVIGYHGVYRGKVGCVGRGRGGSGVVVGDCCVYGGKIG